MSWLSPANAVFAGVSKCMSCFLCLVLLFAKWLHLCFQQGSVNLALSIPSSHIIQQQQFPCRCTYFSAYPFLPVALLLGALWWEEEHGRDCVNGALSCTLLLSLCPSHREASPEGVNPSDGSSCSRDGCPGSFVLPLRRAQGVLCRNPKLCSYAV